MHSLHSCTLEGRPRCPHESWLIRCYVQGAPQRPWSIQSGEDGHWISARGDHSGSTASITLCCVGDGLRPRHSWYTTFLVRPLRRRNSAIVRPAFAIRPRSCRALSRAVESNAGLSELGFITNESNGFRTAVSCRLHGRGSSVEHFRRARTAKGARAGRSRRRLRLVAYSRPGTSPPEHELAPSHLHSRRTTPSEAPFSSELAMSSGLNHGARPTSQGAM